MLNYPLEIIENREETLASSVKRSGVEIMEIRCILKLRVKLILKYRLQHTIASADFW